MLFVAFAHFVLDVLLASFLDGGIENLFFDSRVDGESIFYLIENALLLFLVLFRRPLFLGEQFLDRSMIRFQQRYSVLFRHSDLRFVSRDVPEEFLADDQSHLFSNGYAICVKGTVGRKARQT